VNRRFLFIINQNIAPKGATETLKNYFLKHGQYGHVFEATRTVSDVRKQIGSHLHEIDGIITFGGDGTFHCTLNAVYELTGQAGRMRRFGLEGLVFGALIGGSTGNDIGRALKMGDTRRELSRGKELRSLEPVVESAVNDDHIRACDIGYFELRGRKREVFFSILGAGYDARVVQRANTLRKRYGKHLPGLSRLSYFLGALLLFMSYKPTGVRSLRINGMPVELHEKTFMVALMNLRRAGGGLMLNPHGIMDDRAFELVVLGDSSKPISKLRLVGLLFGAFLGRPNVHHPKVRYFSSSGGDSRDRKGTQTTQNIEKHAIQRVQVEFEKEVLGQADGDILPRAIGYEAGLCPYELQVITGSKNTL
jgi:diacylglycerol kinase family enzyme